MRELFGRNVYALIGPLAVLWATGLLVTRLEWLPVFLTDVLDFFPYLLIVLGALLAAWFNSSRTVFAFLLVFLGYGLLWMFFPVGLPEGAFGRVVYPGYAVLFPLNMLVFTFLEDRGVLTRWGGVRFAGVLIQGGLLWGLVSGFGGLLGPENRQALMQAVEAGLHHHVPFMEYFPATPLPPPALAAFLGVSLVLGLRVTLTGHPVDSGFLGAVLAVGCALHFVGEGLKPAVFFISASALLLGAHFMESYRLAFLDELTGLPGRRALMMDLKKLSGRYTLAMADVDHFKEFNDTYGHDVGDQVLKMVASRLADVTGEGRAYRYGGEEFTIVFPGTDLAAARPHLEAVRNAVENAGFTLREKDRPKRTEEAEKKRSKGGKKKKKNTISITASFGAAARDRRQGTPETVIREADHALYKAKEAGRNRVVTA